MAVDKTKDIQVGGTLHSIATGNIIAHADEVMDEDYGKKQSVINQELSNRLTEELKGYLPLTGGTMNGNITFPNTLGILIQNKTNTDLLNAAGGTTSISDLASKYVTLDTQQNITEKKVFSQGIQISSKVTESTPDNIIVGANLRNLANRVIYVPTAGDDHFILYTGGSSDNGFTVLATGDKGNSAPEPIFITQCSGVNDTISRLITLLDNNGNQKFNSVTATGYTISGKTANDLLNAAGSTTSIDEIKVQVQAAIVDSAPETLDTLNELAAALGDDPNFATTIATQIGNKQDTLVSGTNIKTLGGESILGSGNFEVASSSDIQALFN